MKLSDYYSDNGIPPILKRMKISIRKLYRFRSGKCIKTLCRRHNRCQINSNLVAQSNSCKMRKKKIIPHPIKLQQCRLNRSPTKLLKSLKSLTLIPRLIKPVIIATCQSVARGIKFVSRAITLREKIYAEGRTMWKTRRASLPAATRVLYEKPRF